MHKLQLDAPPEVERPRILLWDIETLPNIVATFQLFDKYNKGIPTDNILHERVIVSAAWQWLDEKNVQSVSLLDDPKLFKKDHLDDTHVVNTLAGILSQADAVVHHNGNAFDLKWTETRMIHKGLKPLPPMIHLDTLMIARKRFMFNSNRLDYLGKFLGVGEKIDTPKGLWIRALNGDRDAIKTMVDYNKGDIDLLREVFLKLRPYIPDHLNRQLFGHEGCPRCSSLDVQKRGLHFGQSQKYQRFQCNSCGGWYRDRKAIAGGGTKTRVL